MLIRRFALCSILPMFALVVSPNVQSDGCFVGGSNPIQHWDTVEDFSDCENADPVKIIEGTIAGIRQNSSREGLCPEPDDDWNIMLHPDPGFEWVLANSSGQLNRNSPSLFCGITLPGWFSDENGLIELEVKSTRPTSGLDLDEFFHGAHVVAKGYWVEDSGHDDKTELHPLRSLVSEGADFDTLFIVQEKSRRFLPNQWPVSELFSYDFSVTGLQRNLLPALDGNTLISNSGAIWRESLFLDHYNILNSGTIATRSRARLTNVNSNGSLSLAVDLNAASPGIRSFYLGTIERRYERPVLSEQFDIKLSSGIYIDSSGNAKPTKSLNISIVASLRGVPDDVSCVACPPTILPQYSRWTYDYSTPYALTRSGDVTISTPTDHEIEINLVYHPDSGYTDTRWELAVTGLTVPVGSSPNPPIQTGPNGPHMRSALHDKRVYLVTPSTMDVDSELIRSKVDPGNAIPPRTCTIGYALERNDMLFPGVSNRNVQWQVQQTHDSTGGINESTIFNILPSGQFAFTGARFEVDPSNDTLLQAIFSDLGWNVKGGLFRPWIPKNQSAFKVIATTETELGEQLSAEIDLNLSGCPSKFLLNKRYRYWRRLLPFQVWAREHGYPTWPVPPPEALEEIGKEFPNGIPPVGDAEHTLRRLDTKSQALYRAWRAQKNNRILTDDELQLISDNIVILDKSILPLPRKEPALLSELREAKAFKLKSGRKLRDLERLQTQLLMGQTTRLLGVPLTECGARLTGEGRLQLEELLLAVEQNTSVDVTVFIRQATNKLCNRKTVPNAIKAIEAHVLSKEQFPLSVKVRGIVSDKTLGPTDDFVIILKTQKI